MSGWVGAAALSKTVPLRDYQARSISELRAAFRVHRAVILQMPTGCHRIGQGILRANGRTVHVQNIQVGDSILGPSGPRTVTEVHRGRGRMAKIIPVKGQAFVVNVDHILTLIRTNEFTDGQFPCQRLGGEVVDVTVADWLEWSNNRKHLFKLFRSPSDFKDAVDIHTVSPYFMGVFLGDGSAAPCTVYKNDPEIALACAQEAARFGVNVRTTQGTCSEYRFKRLEGQPNRLRNALAILGLKSGVTCDTKFIPDEYLYSHKEDRLSCLAGLIDTDGSLSKSGYDFISKSKRLSDGVAFLARSVGLAAYVSECRKGCQTGAVGTYWRVSISGDCSRVPCRIPRKIAPTRNQKKDVLRTGFSVELLPGEEDYYGFTLDGDGRYLLDDFTVTHNSGKTKVAAEIIRNSVARNRRVLFLVHRIELIMQAHARIQVPHGIIKAGMPEDRSMPVQIASIQTLTRREKPPAELVIVDECQHAAAKSWCDLLDHYQASLIIGLSATPSRLDGKPLRPPFEAIVKGASVRELVDLGYLVIPTVYSHPPPDVSKLRSRAGDYVTDELAAAMNTPHLLGSIVEHWKRHGDGRQTVVFAVNVAHSLAIRDEFRSTGIHAEHIDATTPADERARLLAGLAAREFLVLCNCMILGEGWDLPTLEVAVLARPTKSMQLARQQIGRIMRIAEGKSAVVLDHAGITHVHGFVQDEPEYSLDGMVKAPRAPPVKNCPECYLVVASSVSVCPECGHVFSAESVREIDHREGELVLVLPDVSRVDEYTRLVATANRNGYRLGWARGRYKERFGVWPRHRDIEAGYKCEVHDMEVKVYGSKVTERCKICLRTP